MPIRKMLVDNPFANIENFQLVYIDVCCSPNNVAITDLLVTVCDSG